MQLNWWIDAAGRGLLAACVLIGVSGAQAEEKRFSLELLDGQAATFEVPFDVEFPGIVIVQADWAGSRTLSFRVVPPQGTGITHRRTTPSPASIRIPVTADQTGGWMLIIHALPLRGAGSGRLTIVLPGSTPLRLDGADAPPGDVATPPRTLESWQQPRAPRAIDSAAAGSLLRATESFRSFLLETDPRAPDACRWQDDLLRWLSTQRDRSLDEGIEPAIETQKLMQRLADAIGAIELLRTSSDPIVVGPVPADRRRRAAWMRVRGSRLLPIERELDALLTAVQRKHAPELEGQNWPVRMVSCLTATERYFEQRWIVGEDEAPNRELALAQWEPMHRAADALAAVGEIGADAPIRLGAPGR